MSAAEIRSELRALGDPDIAEHSQRFFRTGPGEYGEGDQFLGIRVPVLRKLVPRHVEEPLPEITRLLHSDYHEVRLIALLVLVRRFERPRATETEREAIYRLYLDHRAQVNNWDLVDSSAHPIVGGWLLHRPRNPLYQLAASDRLWDRRIAMMACYHFIRRDDFGDALAIAERLLGDREDLIHKVTGWMLREVGNRDGDAERAFLRRHAGAMPRTMLRYAIEKFPPAERKAWLAGGPGASDRS